MILQVKKLQKNHVESVKKHAFGVFFVDIFFIE